MKNTKKILASVFTLITLNSTMGLYAECKLQKEEIDEFTGKKNRSTRAPLYAGWNDGMVIILAQNGDSTKITINYSLPGRFDVIVKKGSEMMVKLENGNILKLISLSEAIPSVQTVTIFKNDQIQSTYSVDYSVKPEDLKQLGESPIVAIRALFNEEKTFSKLDKGQAKRIMQDSACLIQSAQK